MPDKNKKNQNLIDERHSDKRFFRMLYTLYAISAISFAARVLLSTVAVDKDLIIGIAVAAVFVGIAGFFAYTAFIRKQGFEKSKLMIKLEYAAFALMILQLVLSFTDL